MPCASKSPDLVQLLLTDDLWCLPRETDSGNDPQLAEGTPIRDLWRGEDYGELGFAWHFVAEVDGDRAWRAYETMLDAGDAFPVTIVRGSR